MKKNAYPRILNTIISISFILCAFLGSVHFWCFHEPFYDSEHAKIRLYDKSIAEHIGISEDDLKELTSFTLHYLNDPKADLDIQMQIKGQLREVYTEDEKAHMVDVRNLNLAANRILLAAAAVLILNLVTFIFVKGSLHTLYRVYLQTLLGVLLLFSLLLVWILIDFDSFWTCFHHVFFSGNDLWILDLRKDILIMIVPPQFFNDLVLRIAFTFLILIIGFAILLYCLSRRKMNDPRRTL